MIPSCWSRREACGLQAVTLVVPDYDAGTALFAGKPRFGLIGDTPLGGGKRRVMVAPRGGETRLLLAERKGERQCAAIGNQAGGRVGFFLETDDFGRDPAAFMQRGAAFTEAPRREDYGKFAVFRRDFGSLRDLIQNASRRATRCALPMIIMFGAARRGRSHG